MKQNVKIQKLHPQAQIPRYGSEYSAGADLCALLDEPKVLKPGETAMIPTGLAVEIPEGFAGLIFARSGLACKSGLAPANKVGVIDADYRGEVKVALLNHSAEERVVNPGDRIAQLVITPFLKAVFQESQELSSTDRGEGGFGSTGK